MQTDKNLIAEVAKTARLHTINAEPNGKDFFAAARYHGVAENEVATVAELAAMEYQNQESEARRPLPAREPSEREALKLRGNDRIEGEDVVLVFKRGREVRMPKTEWKALVDRHPEPHSVASLRLQK